MKPQTFQLALADTRRWAQAELLPRIQKGSFLLLSGPMGVGKTTLVKVLVELLGGENAQSPTFAFHHSYDCSAVGSSPGSSVDSSLELQHFDLYRISDESDLESIGFWDFLSDQESLFVIEWPERLPANWCPKRRTVIAVDLQFLPQSDLRSLTIKTVKT